ncbi:MAG: flavodoxin family protein [Christensenellaceae bacterium]|nr:flavodoxin family protein [Christensenellaceae bacterium]
MKKVLVISASPRKGGNSDRLCDEFVRGSKEAGHDVKKVFISDLKINYCTGCGACNTTHKCVIKDDTQKVLDDMLKADVIVLATPVYFYSMDAQLKTLIDRTVPVYEQISGKDFYFILTAADTDENMMKRTVEALRGFTEDCLEDAREKEIIMALGVWQKGEIEGHEAIKKAYNAGLCC